MNPHLKNIITITSSKDLRKQDKVKPKLMIKLKNVVIATMSCLPPPPFSTTLKFLNIKFAFYRLCIVQQQETDKRKEWIPAELSFKVILRNKKQYFPVSTSSSNYAPALLVFKIGISLDWVSKRELLCLILLEASNNPYSFERNRDNIRSHRTSMALMTAFSVYQTNL